MKENNQYRMFKSITSSFIAVGICLAPFVVHADIYRWTDENGKVHFSDKPVGDKAKKLDIKEQTPAPKSTQSGRDRKKKTDQYLRGRKEERAELDRQDEEKKQLKIQRKRECKIAKDKHQEIIEAGAVYFSKKDGSRDYLGEDRRLKEETRLKAEVDKWCK